MYVILALPILLKIMVLALN